MSAVTLPPIRYVFKCFGCDGFGVSDRKDKLTCSPKCRVRLHRDPERRDFLEFVRAELGVNPGWYARHMTAMALCPEALEQAKGDGGVDAIAQTVWEAAVRAAKEQEANAR